MSTQRIEIVALPDFRRWSSVEIGRALLTSRLACECEAIEREMCRRGEVTREQLAVCERTSWRRARQLCCRGGCALGIAA